jgi:Leucine-rich repeat (LRR) protein
MINVNAQEWLDEKYPANGTCQRGNDSENKNKTRKEIITLDIRKSKVGSLISGKKLFGSLKLEGFANLRKLIVSSHQLIGLDVSDCPNLEELDCRSNEINNNNLNVSGCSNLKKIDCSNNNIEELDLGTCFKLEEVNINNCSNLTEDKIKSNLAYNPEKGKLVRDDSKAKSGPQIFRAKEDDIRNILIVGITGNGKSTLANVLSCTGQFTENASSTSVTKNFQKSDIFQWKGRKYCVVDNIGFSDTSMKKEDLLCKIGEGIRSTREGINQILFVFRGRFSTEQIAIYNMFKGFIAQSGITKFTTLVKAGFEDFEDPQLCEEDKQGLLEQATEIREIINSSNGIIYVNNPEIPTVEEKDSDKIKKRKERQKRISEGKRKVSKEKVLDYLTENCQEIYKLENWDCVYDRVNSYVEQIEKKQQELEKTSNSSEKTRLQNEIKEDKGKFAEEVNATLGVKIGPIPELTAQIEWKGVHFSNPFKK